ncbi:MAG: DUF4956 domain-containing protein [Clostridiales bacterium]|nr:DUF4956 domain-containing protein [Clostridiales bacterium]
MLNSLISFSSIIETSIDFRTYLICTAVSLILGILTAVITMFKNRCSQSFAVTLAILPAAVQTVIMLVNGNIGAGVAVAGAFSLVRFRSAPGNAREIGAIFSAMAIGLATGMGYVTLAVVFFAVTAAFTLILSALNFGETKGSLRSLKVTIPENLDYDGIFDDLFAKYTAKAELDRVKTTNMGTMFELDYSIELKSEEVPKEFLDEIRVRNGNLNITCGRRAEKEAL